MDRKSLAFARNPLLEEQRIQNRAVPSRTPAPGLFNSGDLPRATASGNPVADLLRLPWAIRHHAAQADQREWARLMNAYADNPDADLEVQLFEQDKINNQGNSDYRQRFADWLYGR